MTRLIVTKWGARLAGARFPCAVGRGGIGAKLGEGDGVSPEGYFTLTHWLFRPDRLKSHAAQPVRCHETWSDDPRDPRYNDLCRWGTHRPFSSERLTRADPLYDLIGVLDFNRAPRVPGKGSAIFLHIWRKPRHPTEGCIAFARPDLLWLHQALPVGSQVVIKS